MNAAAYGTENVYEGPQAGCEGLAFHWIAAADLACKRMPQLFSYDRISQRTGNLVVKNPDEIDLMIRKGLIK